MTHILETLGDKLAPMETREMMVLADEDGDGNINYEEFISMLFKVVIMIIILMIFNIYRDNMDRGQKTRTSTL